MPYTIPLTDEQRGELLDKIIEHDAKEMLALALSDPDAFIDEYTNIANTHIWDDDMDDEDLLDSWNMRGKED